MSEIMQPLTWQTSINDKPEIINTLPESVQTCLNNARYLHLATCKDNKPHVSLMNYTYIQSYSPLQLSLPKGPLIIMTINTESRKAQNIISNSNVSLLVHDWVSSREINKDEELKDGPSLSTLLKNLNSSEMGSISATINGNAILLKHKSEEEKWCRDQHMKNHSINMDNKSNNINDECGIIVISIKDGTISDYNGGVRDFILQ